MGKRNMYDCPPCPKCKGRYCYPTQNCEMHCDDCGYIGALPKGHYALRDAAREMYGDEADWMEWSGYDPPGDK